MKYHYIYFISIPILMTLALMLPLNIDEFADGIRHVKSSFDDGFTAAIFLIPTVVAAILLLIRNYSTAVIGTCLFILAFGLSGFMNYSLNFEMSGITVGIGPLFIFIVLLTAFIFSIIHTSKLLKTTNSKKKDNQELLDTI